VATLFDFIRALDHRSLELLRRLQRDLLAVREGEVVRLVRLQQFQEGAAASPKGAASLTHFAIGTPEAGVSVSRPFNASRSVSVGVAWTRAWTT